MRRRGRWTLARVAGVVVIASLVSPLSVTPARANDFQVALTASATDVTPGTSVLLTARSNVDVGPTPYYIEIYDTTVRAQVAICNTGTTCSTHVEQFAEACHVYLAVIAEYGGGYPPAGVVATSNSVGVCWSYVVATTAVAGGVGFTATTYLPRFPCPPPPPYGNGPCGGTLAGTTHGHLAGTVGLDLVDVTWEGASAGTLAATFSYSEWSCDGTEDVIGTAFGSGAASADRPSVVGYYHAAGEPFARAILGLRAQFAFNWLRQGASAVISFESLDVFVSVDGLGERRVLTGARLAAAAFAVTGTDAAVVPTCAQPLTNVHGEVVGTLPVGGREAT